MTIDVTARLNLPLIAEAQAQKHVTHNEGLLLLDAIVQATVQGRTRTDPPATPADGEAWLVPAGATGDWAGRDDAIAVWQNGAWRLIDPQVGWRVWVIDEGLLVVWTGSAWTRAFGGIGSLNPADGGRVGVNTTADDTNRLAVKSDAVLFSHDDASGAGSGDVRVTVNKAAAGNTASFVFQDNWSGRAEIGLAGDDDFRFKVSPDGSTWHESIVIDRSSGNVTVPAISGDGSGLTGVNAERLGGDPASAFAKLSGAVFTGGVTATAFSGDGGGLTNVDATYLGGRSPDAYALLSGADFTGAVSAAAFSGDGGGLTNVDAAKLGGRPPSDYALASDVPAAVSLNPADGGKVGVNTTADDTNRLAVKSDAVLFSHDDASGSGAGDVRVTVNKAAAGNTASFVFQDNWSGRAEIGLAGDDDFRFKVSPDGSTWHESIVIDRNSGWVRFPSGGVREVLRDHRSYYVSPDGSDAADGLSPATALRTVQEAVDRCYRLDSNGYTVTIRLLPGVHEGNVIVDRRIVGDARLAIVGEALDPTQVVLRANVAIHTVRVIDGAKVLVANMQLENALNWSQLFADTAADLKYENIVFTSCSRDHVEARANAIVYMSGDCRIVGGARTHINLTNGAVYLAVNRTVKLENTPHFSTAFAWFQRGAHYSIWNVAWTGAATGQRYIVRSNATCNGPTADHFPGDVPGMADTGGYYGPA